MKLILLFTVFIKEVFFATLLLCGFTTARNGEIFEKMPQNHNPCCRMPCQHRGICNPVSSFSYECVCPAGYYGRSCEKSTLFRWMADCLSVNQAKKQKFALTGKLFWGIVNNVPTLHDAVLRYLYIRGSDLEGFHHQIMHYRLNYNFYGFTENNSYLARGLPPVPLECPTPLGIKGPRILPKVDDVFVQLFERTEFKPCPLGTNLLFATFAQHLSYQLFNINYPDEFWFKNEHSRSFRQRDSEEIRRRALRSWVNGKLKTRIINEEEYPPYLEDVPDVFMYYPQVDGKKPIFPKWAMPHKMFSITPMMFAMATIWLREHNRICDIIIKEHPNWSDEKIYQTARWIILGELLTITASEYFQHLAQYRLKLGYKPHLIHNKVISSSNLMQYEFSLSFQWHQMMPDVFSLQGKCYNLSDLTFSNNRIVFEHGLDAIVDLMGRTPAGQITFQNCGKAFKGVMKQLIEDGRRNRLRSFNDYRRFFGLNPYASFLELTGNKEIADILEDLYEEIDAVEYVVGIFLEKHVGSVAPPTMILLAGPVALREILNNPIGSSSLWRPSTFGGKFGFDIVQKASLKKLFCLNLKGNCKNNVWVSFRTPSNVIALSKKKGNSNPLKS